jgi:hypothetical protein
VISRAQIMIEGAGIVIAETRALLAAIKPDRDAHRFTHRRHRSSPEAR